jgi:protein ImuB
MPLGTAHRLAPEATFLDPEPDTDRRAVEAALERLATFSPGLAGAVESADPSFGRLELQTDGLERLWGPDPELVARITRALTQILPGPPRAGIAGTRFAATIAAAHSERGSPVIVPPKGESAFLAPRPSGLLTPDLDIRARLARLGLRQIGQVAEIPRSALIARFGAEGERIGARARGEETDPFRPRRAPERLVLGLPIDPPVEALDALRFVLHRLAAALADQVVARGAAADRAELRLTLDRAFAVPETPSSLAFRQRFPEPTAEAEAIERLFLAQLERTPPPAPVERLELELAGVAPFAGQQLSLLVPQAARDSRLNWQLARLALAFGEDRIHRLEIVDPEAPLPELRTRWIAVSSGAASEEQG